MSELPPPEQIRDRRKAAGISGLTPRRKKSGTSLNSPDATSKACNGRVKKCLYMAGVQALRRSPDLRDFYMRLVGSGKHPKQALAAVMRKIFARALSVYTKGVPWQSAT